MSATLLATAAATLFMTGLIWFVQVVHYPLLVEVGEREFARFHELHSRRVTWIVLPVMAVELVTALVLALAPPDGVPGGLAWTGLALAAGTWVSTALIQAPAHGRLGRQRTERQVGRLVAGNWLRTGLWTAHGAVVIAMLAAVG